MKLSTVLILMFAVFVLILSRKPVTANSCSPGSWRDNSNGVNLCIPCATGHYCPSDTALEDGTLLKACPSGTYLPYTGASSINECSKCDLGTYAAGEGHIRCDQCPHGAYCDTIGLTNPKLCPPGTYQAEIGAISVFACRPCPIGTSHAQSGGYECIDLAQTPILISANDVPSLVNDHDLSTSTGTLTSENSFVTTTTNLMQSATITTSENPTTSTVALVTYSTSTITITSNSSSSTITTTTSGSLSMTSTTRTMTTTSSSSATPSTTTQSFTASTTATAIFSTTPFNMTSTSITTTMTTMSRSLTTTTQTVTLTTTITSMTMTSSSLATSTVISPTTTSTSQTTSTDTSMMTTENLSTIITSTTDQTSSGTIITTTVTTETSSSIVTTTQPLITNYYIQFSFSLNVSNNTSNDTQLADQLMSVFTRALDVPSNRINITITNSVLRNSRRIMAQVRFFSTATESADTLLSRTRTQLDSATSEFRRDSLTAQLNSNSIVNVKQYYICSNGAVQESPCITSEISKTGSSLTTVLLASIIPSIFGTIILAIMVFLIIRYIRRPSLKRRTSRFDRF